MRATAKPHPSTARLSIKLASKPSVPSTFFSDTWTKLHTALVAVFGKTPGEYSKEELYSMVEDACLHKYGTQLYTQLHAEIDAHLINTSLASQIPGEVISFLAKKWAEFTDELRAIRLIFLYLDRTLKTLPAPPEGGPPLAKSLWDMGLKLFRKRLESDEAFLDTVVASVLHVIEQERQAGLELDEAHHYEVVRMLGMLGMNFSHFEPRFLDSSRAFYNRESLVHLESLVVPDYLLYVDKCLRAEADRGLKFLDSARRPLTKVTEQALIADHAQVLVDKGLGELLDDSENRSADLVRMYRLLSLVGEQGKLVTAFSQYTKAKGALIVQGAEADMVSALISFKAKTDNAVKLAFNNDNACQRATRDAFETFLNTKDYKPAELIAKFVDRQLRSAGSVDEIQVALTRCTELFRYLHAKDVFEEFYKTALAKRLLLGTSCSDDLERVMVSYLKSECGANFTNKLEGMFRDMELSRTHMNDWRAWCEAKNERGLEMSVHVLSMGFWPTYSDVQVVLPPQLLSKQAVFEEFYMSKFEKGRRLNWRHALGHCLIKAILPKGKWDLDVSVFQALVLLLFNGAKQLSYAQIQAQTGLEGDTLARVVQSLALARKEQRVLKRVWQDTTVVMKDEPDEPGEEADEEFSANQKPGKSGPQPPRPGDVFAVDVEWSSKRKTLKINQIQAVETKKETEDSYTRIQADRQYQIDAAIVRIMKSRKRLMHAQLIAELVKQLPFAARPQDLKKRIESLIDREYLEREETDSNCYLYVA